MQSILWLASQTNQVYSTNHTITFNSGGIVGLVTYVLLSLALYAIANRRNIRHAWLAWVPVGRMWLLGSISDQYRSIVYGETKNKRTVLLVISLLKAVLAVAAVVAFVLFAVSTVTQSGLLETIVAQGGEITEAQAEALIPQMMPLAGGILIFGFAGAVLGITSLVFSCKAMHDVLKSCGSDSATLFTVLYVLISVATAIYLFTIREKDDGMIPPQTGNYGGPNGYHSAQPGNNPGQYYTSEYYQQPRQSGTDQDGRE